MEVSVWFDLMKFKADDLCAMPDFESVRFTVNTDFYQDIKMQMGSKIYVIDKIAFNALFDFFEKIRK